MDIRKLIKDYAVFGIGGMLIFLFNLLMTIVLTEQFNVRYNISFAIVLFISVFLAFLYHSKITFRAMNKKQKYFFFPYYFLSAAIFWSISFLISTYSDLHYTLAITLAVIPISMMNFTIDKRYIFN